MKFEEGDDNRNEKDIGCVSNFHSKKVKVTFWTIFLDYQEARGSHYSGCCLKIILVRDGLLDVRAEEKHWLLHHKSKQSFSIELEEHDEKQRKMIDDDILIKKFFECLMPSDSLRLNQEN